MNDGSFVWDNILGTDSKQQRLLLEYFQLIHVIDRRVIHKII